MKNNFIFFLGLFAALGISWGAIVMGSNAQLGALAPYYDDTQGGTFPEWMPGVAARGQRVYRDLGCAACHTQQVRRPDFGSDKDRGWGDRQSVARDYIYQPFPQLGLSRVGPDLTNLGDRKPTAPDADDLLQMLYSGSDGMPSYRFLFERRKIGNGAQPSDEALKLTGALKPKAGWEIVPSSRALDLVGYLVSLKTTYDYPEAVPFVPEKAEGEKPAAPATASPAPAAAPTGAPVASPTPGAPVSPTPGGVTSPSPVGTVTPTPAGPVPTQPTNTSPAPAAVVIPKPTPTEVPK